MTICSVSSISILRLSATRPPPLGSTPAAILQDLITCDITPCTQGRSVRGAFCNGQGKVVTTATVMPQPLVAPVSTPVTSSKEKLARCKDFAGALEIMVPADMTEIVVDYLSQACKLGRVSIEQLDDQPPLAFWGDSQPTQDALMMTGELLPASQDNHPSVVADTADELSTTSSIWLASPSLREVATQVADATDASKTLLQAISWRRMQLGCLDIPLALSNQFLPHQLLFEQTKGLIDFGKGCYLGQEIIARIQYKGKVKRYLQRFSTTETLSPSQYQLLLNFKPGDQLNWQFTQQDGSIDQDNAQLLAIHFSTLGHDSRHDSPKQSTAGKPNELTGVQITTILPDISNVSAIHLQITDADKLKLNRS